MKSARSRGNGRISVSGCRRGRATAPSAWSFRKAQRVKGSRIPAPPRTNAGDAQEIVANTSEIACDMEAIAAVVETIAADGQEIIRTGGKPPRRPPRDRFGVRWLDIAFPLHPG